jgi:hypothetical protein
MEGKLQPGSLPLDVLGVAARIGPQGVVEVEDRQVDAQQAAEEMERVQQAHRVWTARH